MASLQEQMPVLWYPGFRYGCNKRSVLPAELWGWMSASEELNDLDLPCSGTTVTVVVSREQGDGFKTLARVGHPASSQLCDSILGSHLHENNFPLKNGGCLLLAQKHCAKSCI